MRSLSLVSIFILACVLVLSGCSGGQDPVTPAQGPDLTLRQSTVGPSAQTHLWGYYEVFIDVENQDAYAVPLRGAMFTANVVNFLNSKPSGLSFHINGTPSGPDYVDVDIDVSLTHPFPGMQQYDGYDVRGVFMGDGSASLLHNTDLIFAVTGVDQSMFPDPLDGFGGPDGYTRFFNYSEFPLGGMPLLSYTKGKVASQGFAGTATVNPCKYFANGLETTEDLWSWLLSHADQHGEFTSGATNTRNYYLRFPKTKGVEFGYAVLANWNGPNSEDHPSNAVESVALKADVTPSLYYANPGDKGGKLILDLSLFGWEYQPSTIVIESTVLSGYHELDSSEMIPTGGGDNYSTYHVEIPADNITGTEGNEFWVIARYDAFDYSNDFGVPNEADGDPLEALFRSGLEVASESPCQNWVPVVDTLNDKATWCAVNRPYTGWTIKGDLFEDGDLGVAVNNGASDVAVGTNVQWIDQNTITFDIDLTSVAVGTYDIVVTNGCGDQKTGVGVDMLKVLKWIHVVGDPNIDVVTGLNTPIDIAIDPSSDQVAISYGKYWRKWTSDYASSSPNYDSWYNKWLVDYVDLGAWDAQSGFIYYCHEASPWYPGQYECWSWTGWSGVNSILSYWQPGPNDEMKDIANLQGTNDLWGVYDWADNTSGSYCSILRTWDDNKFTYPAHIGAPFYDGSGTTGVVMDNLRAIDFPEYPGSGNPDMYFLEYLPATDTAVVEKWHIANTPTYLSSFGEGLFFDPIDMTVDSSYNVYVLEENSDGNPVIWAHDSSGQLVGYSEPLTTTEISGDLLRMDAHLSKNPDEVHVLHTLGVTKFAM